MAYENKKQPTDGPFEKTSKKDGPHLQTSAQIAAANSKAAKGLQKSIDAAPHPYSISARHDEAELKMRGRKRR